MAFCYIRDNGLAPHDTLYFNESFNESFNATATKTFVSLEKVIENETNDNPE